MVLNIFCQIFFSLDVLILDFCCFDLWMSLCLSCSWPGHPWKTGPDLSGFYLVEQRWMDELTENRKNMTQMQTFQNMAIHLNWQTLQGGVLIREAAKGPMIILEELPIQVRESVVRTNITHADYITVLYRRVVRRTQVLKESHETNLVWKKTLWSDTKTASCKKLCMCFTILMVKHGGGRITHLPPNMTEHLQRWIGKIFSPKVG